jgi:hypothetical protein
MRGRMMDDLKKLVVCEKSPDYRYQGPRFKKLGDASGEEFRDSYLLPWLDSLADGEKGVIDFINTAVYSPSFLEESFGGAVRKDAKNRAKLRNVIFAHMDPIWKEKVEKYIKSA